MQEINELCDAEGTNGALKHSLKALIKELWYLHHPLVQETKELCEANGWDSTVRSVRKQVGRFCSGRLDTKVPLEDPFSRPRDVGRQNINKRVCRFKSYRTVLDSPFPAKRGKFSDLRLTEADCEQPVQTIIEARMNGMRRFSAS